jgi:hypothetical protein
MKRDDGRTIPAFLSIDVEPDAFQLARDDADCWPGYADSFALAASLRDALSRASGAAPRFGWYFRMDPQIAAVFGRADVAMSAFPERIEALRAAGDYFGAHAHPLRRSREHAAWVHDFASSAWLRECTQATLDAFAACTGERVRRFRAGAGFLCDDIVDVLDRNGVDAELSLEPIESGGLRMPAVTTSIDESPLIGRYTNCVDAPRVPYHPSAGDFRRRGNGDARRILLVPMSTACDRDAWRGVIDSVRRRLFPPREPVRMLYMAESWPSPRYFWDLVDAEASAMTKPYVSLALRTEQATSVRGSRVAELLRALVEHPLAERLRFVDPLEALAS